MSVAEAIRNRSVLLTITRYNGVTTVNGYRVNNTPTVISQAIYMQPMSTKDLRNVPEGQNTLQWMNVFSESEVKLKDIISYTGVNFEVMKIAPRPEGAFYRGAAVKVNDAP